MSIRETMNRNPGITTGVTVGIIVIALLWIIWGSLGNSGGGAANVNKAYFTDNDGATWFTDDARKIPPFDHGGKPAVRAHVFQCKGGQPFVVYLERYTAEAKPKMEAAVNSKTPDISVIEMYQSNGLEVKPPKTGDKGWINLRDRNYEKIKAPICPGGGTDAIELAP